MSTDHKPSPGEAAFGVHYPHASGRPLAPEVNEHWNAVAQAAITAKLLVEKDAEIAAERQDKLTAIADCNRSRGIIYAMSEALSPLDGEHNIDAAKRVARQLSEALARAEKAEGDRDSHQRVAIKATEERDSLRQQLEHTSQELCSTERALAKWVRKTPPAPSPAAVEEMCPECGGATESDHNSFQCHKCKKLWPKPVSSDVPTPRVDMACRDLGIEGHPMSRKVSADWARTLERETIALKQEIKEAWGQLATMPVPAYSIPLWKACQNLLDNNLEWLPRCKGTERVANTFRDIAREFGWNDKGHMAADVFIRSLMSETLDNLEAARTQLAGFMKVGELGTPRTDACYVRAGMMLADQQAELDAECRKLEAELNWMKKQHGEDNNK